MHVDKEVFNDLGQLLHIVLQMSVARDEGRV